MDPPKRVRQSVKQQACALGAKCLHAENMSTINGIRKRGRRRTVVFIERNYNLGIDLQCSICSRFCCSVACLRLHQNDPANCSHYVPRPVYHKQMQRQNTTPIMDDNNDRVSGKELLFSFTSAIGIFEDSYPAHLILYIFQAKRKEPEVLADSAMLILTMIAGSVEHG